MPVTSQTLIDRRVAAGANREESQHLLAELLHAHSGDNLASALVHQGFATETQADTYVTVRGKHCAMAESTNSTPCSCGFRDREAPHILRCTHLVRFNAPLECDCSTPCNPGYLPVAGEGLL